MTLQIHRAERADTLAEALGCVLATPLADPFRSEVVAVPTQGVERWLAQSLSHQLGTSPGGRDGICAGVTFPSPRRLVAEALGSVTSIDPRFDPWQPRRAVWPLLQVIDQARGEEWAALLWSYLTGASAAGGGPYDVCGVGPAVSGRHARRWSTGQHLARLFADYASNRPAMVLRWLGGLDVDASGQPLPPELAWQAQLWRRLREMLGVPSPAERTESACARLVAEPDVSDLPARLSVVGATRLAPDHRAVLTALAAHRDVHLWLPHASPALWQRLGAAPARRPGPRREDRTAELAAHPLLGYLGRDVREVQLTLAADEPAAADRHHLASAPPPESQPLTLLRRLQRDIAQDQPVRRESERPLLDPRDRSVALHASHGPDRQVEVLRELLVGLLADDPTLEPRDIVVMCPDIERFAPLISASFGLADDERPGQHPGHRLRVRLADRALRQVNPLLAALSRVLALAESRLEASALLDLCAIPPVAAKFAFGEDDLERLQDLVLRAGVRWGLDRQHRSAFAMGQFGQNTWVAGLDRLLLGVTMDESGQQFLGTALPLDDVDSSDVDLVGRLAELVERVRVLLGQLDRARTPAEWVQLCRHILEQLTAVPAADIWQVTHAYGELAALAPPASEEEQESSPLLSLTEVQALLADTFRGRATRANFRTGTLTMCTMLPMRSVPHRVICLLGLDDGVFPRQSSRDGDDILARDPWVGDRDPRSEDRQLLLDAIMSAEEHLVVIYAGADARTRAVTPPAVPIGALLDALDTTARTVDGTPVRDTILTRHPLQPFDPANFTVDPGHDQGEPFSFDPETLRGVLSSRRARRPATTTFDTAGLPEVELPEVIALPELVRFLQHPVRALLRARAGLAPWSEQDSDGDQLPVQLEPLTAWGMGDRLLRLHLEGVDLERLSAAEWRRGTLPPRAFGHQALRKVLDNVRQVAEATRPFLVGPRQGCDVVAQLGDHTVIGTLSTLHEDRLVSVNYSWVGAKHRLLAWVELLALTAACPDRSWQSVTVGRGRPSVLGPVPGPWATMVLADLVQLYRTGLGEPLPLGPKTSAEYARIRYEGKSVDTLKDKLHRTWNEERDPAYESFFGRGVTFETLLEESSRPEEERGSLAEPSRFGTLARRVWHPLLGSEVLQ